jgi:FKBP-type peptidyl-prolyl cis-trans isomerase 2
VEIGLQGSKDSPVVNPAIRVKNWNSDEAKILVNGISSDNCRVGFNHELDGTELILFVFINTTSAVKISVAK